MSIFLGMDTSEGQRTAADWIACSTTMSTTIADLESRVSTLPWQGPDSEHFRLAFQRLLADQFTVIAAQLKEHGTALGAEAKQQDSTSEAAEGPSGPAAVPVSAVLALSQSSQTLGGALRDAQPNPAAKKFPPIGKPRDPDLGRMNYMQDLATYLPYAIDKAPEVLCAEGVLDMDPAKISMAFAAQYGKLKVEELDPHYTTEPSTIIDKDVTTDASTPTDLKDFVPDNQETRKHEVTSRADEESKSSITVQKVVSDSGEIGYIVQIPPTQSQHTKKSGWSGLQGNARDWASCIAIMQGHKTTAMVDVEQAMEEAGVPKGANVMLTGHSQGGMIAAALAADEGFNGESGYNVSHVFSYGSPVEAFNPAQQNTKVVNVAHSLDPVAMSDGNGIATKNDQVTEVRIDPPSGHKGHKLDTYANHDSIGYNPDGSIDMQYGYYPTIAANQDSNKDLAAFKNDIDGLYIGKDVKVIEETTVTMRRDPNMKKHALMP